jgi:NAD-dependent deacetylase
VITQNIDNLHQKAGCKNVFELHGSAYRNYCMDCGTRYDISCLDNSNIPICTECNGLIRPDVTLYGEMLNENVINTSINHIKKADVMLVLGSSLLVQPPQDFLIILEKNRL